MYWENSKLIWYAEAGDPIVARSYHKTFCCEQREFPGCLYPRQQHQLQCLCWGWESLTLSPVEVLRNFNHSCARSLNSFLFWLFSEKKKQMVELLVGIQLGGVRKLRPSPGSSLPSAPQRQFLSGSGSFACLSYCFSSAAHGGSSGCWE